MAVWNMDGYRPTSASRKGGPGALPGTGRLGKWVKRLGAVISLALILGMAHWGYKLTLRQINGIPVILAPEGPARVAPDNPGGELAQHQGLSVNNVAAVGGAGSAADRLMLAPKPAQLDPADVASDALQASLGTALAPPAAHVPTDAGVVKPSQTLAAMRPRPDQLAVPLPDGAADPIEDPDLTPTEAGPDDTPASGVTSAADGAVPSTAPAPQDILSADVPGVARSPVPHLRPGTTDGADVIAGTDAMAEAAAQAVAAAMAPAGPVDLDPATLASGTQLAQIGSYDSEAQAKLEWEKAVARFGALMDGKSRVIQAAESGGRSFYRLRVAGFKTRDDARRFCAALKTGGQCVPAQVH